MNMQQILSRNPHRLCERVPIIISLLHSKMFPKWTCADNYSMNNIKVVITSKYGKTTTKIYNGVIFYVYLFRCDRICCCCFFSRFFSAFVYTSIDLVTERGDKNEKKKQTLAHQRFSSYEIKRNQTNLNFKIQTEINIKVENNADTYLKNLNAYEKFLSMTRELHYWQQNEQHTHLDIFF